MGGKVLHGTVKPVLFFKRTACNDNYQGTQQKFNLVKYGRSENRTQFKTGDKKPLLI